MTRSEVLAYNAGAAVVLALAARCAQAMAERCIEKPTRYNFAVEALAAIAEEGAAMLLTMPSEVPLNSLPVFPAVISAEPR